MSARVSIKVEGVDKAVKALEKRITKYPEYFGKVIHTALVHGGYMARALYNGGNINTAVTVSAERAHVYYDFAYCKLNADGDAVVFLEYGAGDQAGAGDFEGQDLNFEEDSGVMIYPGSYSEENAQEYSSWGVWFFGGQVYHEIQPRRGMLHASQIVKVDLADTNSKAYQSAESILR